MVVEIMTILTSVDSMCPEDEEPHMPDAPAKLSWDGQEIELPIVRGTEDEVAADISKLRAQMGLITLDYGYMNTGATESAITFIDGDAGILRYRGYNIEDLAEHDAPSFLETA